MYRFVLHLRPQCKEQLCAVFGTLARSRLSSSGRLGTNVTASTIGEVMFLCSYADAAVVALSIVSCFAGCISVETIIVLRQIGVNCSLGRMQNFERKRGFNIPHQLFNIAHHHGKRSQCTNAVPTNPTAWNNSKSSAYRASIAARLCHALMAFITARLFRTLPKNRYHHSANRAMRPNVCTLERSNE